MPRKAEPKKNASQRPRDPTLEAVGFAAEQFLTTDHWEEAVPSVLERLGEATAVSRVYIYENKSREDGALLMDQRYEWCAPGISPTMERPESHDFPYEEGFTHFEKQLRSGKPVYGLVEDYPRSERADMQAEGILSSATVPIFAGDEWWGFMGFDDTETKRKWSKKEIDALTAAAGTLGMTIHRKWIEEQLRGAERQLFEAEARYRALVEQIPAVLYIDPPDASEQTIYVSPQINDILGIPPEEYIENPDVWYELLHPDDRERAQAEYESYLETGQPESSDYRYLRRDGKVVWIHDTSVTLRDEDGRPFLVQGMMYDVTREKEAEQQVAYLAYHDKLTDLPNRAMFEEHLELAIARAQRADSAVAVLFMDLDNFKLLNDSLGHAAGDELLRQMSLRLQDATRETDLVARQGGDEFLVLLADIDAEGEEEQPGKGIAHPYIVAESVAARVQQALAPPFFLSGHEFYSSASIGISAFPLDAPDSATLLKNADAAMYRSKAAGPGQYVVHSEEAPQPAQQLSFTTRLRKAVEKQQWLLYYQPILDLTTHETVCLEALVRWSDPTGGIIRPGEFIPLAEEIGLIDAIGDWVLEELCRQTQAWREEGLEIDVSFNLSPRQLRHPELAEHILPFLEAREVRPERIIMEITESTAMTDPERTQKVLWSLHARGMRLAIDDFGTGASSLSRLKHLPVDILKIDQSFVRDLPGDDHAVSMVQAIIDLAHNLEMTPLAEGIEETEQARFLTEAGCTLGQGYLFSRPVPAEEITARYKRDGLKIEPGGA